MGPVFDSRSMHSLLHFCLPIPQSYLRFESRGGIHLALGQHWEHGKLARLTDQWPADDNWRSLQSDPLFVDVDVAVGGHKTNEEFSSRRERWQRRDSVATSAGVSQVRLIAQEGALRSYICKHQNVVWPSPSQSLEHIPMRMLDHQRRQIMNAILP